MWKIVTAMDRTKLWRHFSATLREADVPPYALHSLAKLPATELTRFGRAWRLLGHGGGVLRLAYEGDMALAGAGVCEALLARSWSARYHDPQTMVSLAVAAQEVAAELKVSDLGRTGVADLQARACGELANAYRVAGRHADADAAFGEAFDRLRAGAHDPFLRNHLDELDAALFASSGDLKKALARLSTLPEAYRRLGDRHLAGRVQVTQSIYTALQGRQEEALRLSAEGLAQIDRRREPRLLMTALHNRLLLLQALGLREEAARTLPQCLRLGTRGELCAVTIRLGWMAGRVCYDLGELGPAKVILSISRISLLAMRLGYFSAMASLDLAATLLRLGETEAGQDQVEVAQIICEEVKDHPELDHPELAALEATVKRVPADGKATPELLEGMLAFLRRNEVPRAA